MSNTTCDTTSPTRRARRAGIAYCLGHITKRGTPAVQTTVRYTQASREQIRAKLSAIG